MRLFLYEVTPQNRDSWSIYCNNLHLDQTHHWILKNKYRFSPTSFCHLKQDVRLNHSLQSYTQKKKKKNHACLVFSAVRPRVCASVHIWEFTPKIKGDFFFRRKKTPSAARCIYSAAGGEALPSLLRLHLPLFAIWVPDSQRTTTEHIDATNTSNDQSRREKPLKNAGLRKEGIAKSAVCSAGNAFPFFAEQVACEVLRHPAKIDLTVIFQ